MTSQLINARRVAEILDVRISTVYALCRRGELVHIRLGEGRRRPLIRFRFEDLQALLEQRTIGPVPRQSWAPAQAKNDMPSKPAGGRSTK